MSNQEIILTAEGLAKLEGELEELKGPKRRELAQRIKTAISYGDLKENSEYHSAKEDQAFMETRILQIQAMLKKARVADSSDTSKIVVGSVVSLLDQEFDEELKYRIVAPAEADVIENRISYESPLGKTLMNKRVGDVIEVDAPVGKINYKVLGINSK
ncbi:transcription elongation factor GreA [Paenibacillus herberti]|uniref:Transcription elongation factor GreA n=1 Tax=Paenibacillus herberti TaxID=1619309 RepID=A0A229NX00_9BACL|nr:transcription elongation factor GreA [Paenibacillus herberti]OXM14347.1 transcription elongation factor GreA [Paenibacillus herberti]